jgi:predicted DNA-binding transcriptional regulator AlpA
LCQALGRSRYTIRRWIDQGILPKPIAITEQSRAWRLRDIEAALDRLARTRRKPKQRGALMQGDVLVQHTKKREGGDAQ